MPEIHESLEEITHETVASGTDAQSEVAKPPPEEVFTPSTQSGRIIGLARAALAFAAISSMSPPTREAMPDVSGSQGAHPAAVSPIEQQRRTNAVKIAEMEEARKQHAKDEWCAATDCASTGDLRKFQQSLRDLNRYLEIINITPAEIGMTHESEVDAWRVLANKIWEDVQTHQSPKRLADLDTALKYAGWTRENVDATPDVVENICVQRAKEAWEKAVKCDKDPAALLSPLRFVDDMNDILAHVPPRGKTGMSDESVRRQLREKIGATDEKIRQMEEKVKKGLTRE